MTISPFAPTVLVGNIPAGDPATTQGNNYIGDPGNGSGIAAALALAGAGRVYVRRGTYDLGAVGAPALPLTVLGTIEGEGAATVLRMSPLDRRVLLLAASDARAANLQVEFTSALAGAVGAECVAAGAVARTRFENVTVVKTAVGVVNALETLTSIFKGGTTALFRGCNARNIDGGPAVSVAAFRSSGPNSTFIQCQGLDGDLGIQLDGTDTAVIGCAFNASVPALIAGYSGIVFAGGGDRSRAVGCRVAGAAYGVRFLAGATACMAGFNTVAGGSVAGVQIDLGATNALVANNQLGGFALVNAEPSALVVNNQP